MDKRNLVMFPGTEAVKEEGFHSYPSDRSNRAAVVSAASRPVPGR
ncbi:hypothetical protein [Paenibacillus sp. JCM 10914]|nr:hypothetical protein [Paenibacillus sp. JCM 10914]